MIDIKRKDFRLVESKRWHISEVPPAGYATIPRAITGGRCLYCGHIPLPNVCCYCKTCICCPIKEAPQDYD